MLCRQAVSAASSPSTRSGSGGSGEKTSTHVSRDGTQSSACTTRTQRCTQACKSKMRASASGSTPSRCSVRI
jgi:hypothetical protein